MRTVLIIFMLIAPGWANAKYISSTDNPKKIFDIITKGTIITEAFNESTTTKGLFISYKKEFYYCDFAIGTLRLNEGLLITCYDTKGRN